jgi:hypothetical protein
MVSTAAAASPSIWKKGEHEVSLARLYVLRAMFLLFAVAGFFVHPQWLFNPSPTARGMIEGMTAGLWMMSFLGFRYPLQMLPIFLFEFVWKTIWLLAFGLPQWMSGMGSPRLSNDLVMIGLGPLVFGLIIPWGYVWRRYVKAPSERWR